MDFTFADIGLIAVIVGLVEVIKGLVPKAYTDLANRLSPVVAIGFGIAAGYVYIAPGDIRMAILSGMVMGLSASGLYSGTKSLAGK